MRMEPVGQIPLGVKPECSIPSCKRNSRARRMCATHYYRFLASGDAMPDAPILKRGQRRPVAVSDNPQDSWFVASLIRKLI